MAAFYDIPGIENLSVKVYASDDQAKMGKTMYYDDTHVRKFSL